MTECLTGGGKIASAELRESIVVARLSVEITDPDTVSAVGALETLNADDAKEKHGIASEEGNAEQDKGGGLERVQDGGGTASGGEKTSTTEDAKRSKDVDVVMVGGFLTTESQGESDPESDDGDYIDTIPGMAQESVMDCLHALLLESFGEGRLCVLPE